MSKTQTPKAAEHEAPQALFARQPIFTKGLEVMGYELLYRQADNTAGEGGDAATSHVLFDTIANIGLGDVVGPHAAFINFTKNILLANFPSALPKEKIVVEVLEDVEVDQHVVDAIKRLKNQGYCIALDDFVFAEQWKPLLEIADIIKLDVLDQNEEQISTQLKSVENYSAKLLAEKVETHAQFEICKKLGFDYFQGFFFSKPKIIAGKRVDANKTVVLQLLAKLQDPNLNLQDLELLVSQDPKLSYKILKINNSVVFSPIRKITSLREAIVRLGVNELRNWATLLALSSMGDTPTEYCNQAILRAKMCEFLGKGIASKQDPARFFIVGLLSMLDVMMQEELPKLLSGLPLDEEIKSALLERQGELGETLSSVIAYEQGNWQDAKHAELDDQDYLHAYADSLACLSVIKDS